MGSTEKTNRTVVKIRGLQAREEIDEIAVEHPLTIYVNHDEFATVVCTPTSLEEMVVGFLASEGVISSYREIKELVLDPDGGFAYADLHRQTAIDPALFSKRRIASCCGKSRQSFYFFSDAKTAHPTESAVKITTNRCFQLMEQLHEASDVHRETGGVHNSAIFAEDGRMLCVYSDIGRHNALDKIHGHCLIQAIDTADTILAFSGRISSEVVLKAAKIGSSILLSKSAPTDLALQLAEELGITTVGFIRGDRMNVYTGAGRISLSENEGNGTPES